MYYIYRVDAISLAYCAARASSHKLVLLLLQGGGGHSHAPLEALVVGERGGGELPSSSYAKIPAPAPVFENTTSMSVGLETAAKRQMRSAGILPQQPRCRPVGYILITAQMHAGVSVSI